MPDTISEYEISRFALEAKSLINDSMLKLEIQLSSAFESETSINVELVSGKSISALFVDSCLIVNVPQLFSLSRASTLTELLKRDVFTDKFNLQSSKSL